MDIMYTVDDRNALAEALEDARLSGAAVCGSMAVGRDDAWSDIDLVLAVADPSRLGEVLDDWTSAMVNRHGAVHHADIATGRRMYRAFLLPSTLEVDLNFVPSGEFRAEGPNFRLLRGIPPQPPRLPAPPAPSTSPAWAGCTRSRRVRVWRAASSGRPNG
jgi:hypothetical protein